MNIINIMLLTCIAIVAVLFSNHTNAQPLNGKYPEASVRLLTQDDLEHKTAWELKIMRNEIFARHGYIFRTGKMRSYFNKQKWYDGKYSDVTSKLSDVEKANIKILKHLEQKRQPKPTLHGIKNLIEAQKRQIVFKASYGSGISDLGRTLSHESMAEGPHSFVVDPSGQLMVLDQENQRVQVFDRTGRHIKAIPLPSRTISDIALATSGNLFILEQFVWEMVLLIDDAGQILKKIKLIGTGITTPSSIKGIYNCRNYLWATTYRGQSIKLCRTSGEIVKQRAIVPGIFSQGGNYYLTASVIGEITAYITRKQVGSPGMDKYNVYTEIPIDYLTLLEQDQKGNIYLGMSLFEPLGQKPPYSLDQLHRLMMILDNTGKELKKIYMPPSTAGLEVVRSLRVALDGSMYQLQLEKNGATMWRYFP